jgi:hypothetical protein
MHLTLPRHEDRLLRVDHADDNGEGPYGRASPPISRDQPT